MKCLDQVTRDVGIPQLCMVVSNLVLETLSKAPLKSRNKAEVINRSFLAISMSWTSDKAASTADRCCLPPSCSRCRRLWASQRYAGLFATSFSDIFSRQFSRVIIRYAFGALVCWLLQELLQFLPSSILDDTLSLEES